MDVLVNRTGNKKIVEYARDHLWELGVPLGTTDCLDQLKWISQGILGPILEEIRDNFRASTNLIAMLYYVATTPSMPSEASTASTAPVSTTQPNSAIAASTFSMPSEASTATVAPELTAQPHTSTTALPQFLSEDTPMEVQASEQIPVHQQYEIQASL